MAAETFDEYIKRAKIVRYVPSFQRCWNAATRAAEEKLNSPLSPTNSVSPKFTCDTNNHSCVAWRPAECSNGNVGCLHRKLRA